MEEVDEVVILRHDVSFVLAAVRSFIGSLIAQSP